MNTYTQSELDKARRYRCVAPDAGYVERHGVTFTPVHFDWWLVSSQGAGFALYREPHHEDHDIDCAKRYLKAERDVVGTIQVYLPEAP